MLDELIELFLRDAPRCIAQIHQALHEPRQMAFHAHALKSMSLNMGARKIVALAQELETLGNTGRVEGAGRLLRELEETYRATQAELRALRPART